MNVSLFITCLTDLFAPHVGLATVKVLRHFGCAVDFPLAQTCCGQPQYNNGYPDQARTLARRMLLIFAHSQYVVTPSASCCAMIREHYPTLFAGTRHEPAARALAAKTYELVEFLTAILKVDLAGLALPEPTAITYHYTCHSRGLSLGEAPGASCINLLQHLGNSTYIPLDKAEQCCGFGGTFAVKYPDISGAMVRDKMDRGNQTAASVMIVNDAGCAMNIAGACRRHHAKFQPRHIAELLADAIDATPRRTQP